MVSVHQYSDADDRSTAVRPRLCSPHFFHCSYPKTTDHNMTTPKAFALPSFSCRSFTFARKGKTYTRSHLSPPLQSNGKTALLQTVKNESGLPLSKTYFTRGTSFPRHNKIDTTNSAQQNRRSSSFLIHVPAKSRLYFSVLIASFVTLYTLLFLFTSAFFYLTSRHFLLFLFFILFSYSHSVRFFKFYSTFISLTKRTHKTRKTTFVFSEFVFVYIHCRFFAHDFLSFPFDSFQSF